MGVYSSASGHTNYDNRKSLATKVWRYDVGIANLKQQKVKDKVHMAQNSSVYNPILHIFPHNTGTWLYNEKDNNYK